MSQLASVCFNLLSLSCMTVPFVSCHFTLTLEILPSSSCHVSISLICPCLSLSSHIFCLPGCSLSCSYFLSLCALNECPFSFLCCFYFHLRKARDSLPTFRQFFSSAFSLTHVSLASMKVPPDSLRWVTVMVEFDKILKASCFSKACVNSNYTVCPILYLFNLSNIMSRMYLIKLNSHIVPVRLLNTGDVKILVNK